MKKIFNKIIVFVAFLTFVIYSCYEPSEGCLESFYGNYDVTADKPCSDCCLLPQLSLNFSYQVDSVTLDTFFYQNNLGLDFRIIDFFLLFNDLNLNGILGNYQIISEDPTLLVSDLSMTRLGEKNTSIRGVMIIDTITGFDLNLGIPTSIANTRSDYMNYPELEYLYENEEYLSDGSFYSAGIDIVLDSLSNDTLQYRFEEIIQDNILQSFLIEDGVAVNKGGGFGVSLVLDFSKLLQDIDIQDSNNPNIFRQKLSNNFKLALGAN